MATCIQNIVGCYAKFGISQSPTLSSGDCISIFKIQLYITKDLEIAWEIKNGLHHGNDHQHIIGKYQFTKTPIDRQYYRHRDQNHERHFVETTN